MSTSASSVPTFGLWYDLRNTARWRQPIGKLYRDTLDQAVWAEQLGFGSAWFSEHHFSDDDYAASPLMLCAALGARYTIDYLPRGVRLTAYSGDAADLPPDVLQGFLDDVAAARAVVPLGRSFRLDEIIEAHTLMENGGAGGKIVVIP